MNNSKTDFQNFFVPSTFLKVSECLSIPTILLLPSYSKTLKKYTFWNFYCWLVMLYIHLIHLCLMHCNNSLIKFLKLIDSVNMMDVIGIFNKIKNVEFKMIHIKHKIWYLTYFFHFVNMDLTRTKSNLCAYIFFNSPSRSNRLLLMSNWFRRIGGGEFVSTTLAIPVVKCFFFLSF